MFVLCTPTRRIDFSSRFQFRCAIVCFVLCALLGGLSTISHFIWGPRDRTRICLCVCMCRNYALLDRARSTRTNGTDNLCKYLMFSCRCRYYAFGSRHAIASRHASSSLPSLTHSETPAKKTQSINRIRSHIFAKLAIRVRPCRLVAGDVCICTYGQTIVFLRVQCISPHL